MAVHWRVMTPFCCDKRRISYHKEYIFRRKWGKCMREMELLAKREGNIVKKPLDEMVELEKEDMEFLEDNEIIKKINSLFILNDENRDLRYLMGKLIYAEFIMKYLMKYSEILENGLNIQDFSLQKIYEGDFINSIKENIEKQKDEYVISSFSKILIELSNFFDELDVKSMEDLVLLSNISDVQYKMIENVKNEDIFWLYETLNQFNRKLNNLRLLHKKQEWKVSCTYFKFEASGRRGRPLPFEIGEDVYEHR